LRKAERVRRVISEEIIAGRYPPGSMLPSYKELAQRHGACYTTLRETMERMLEDGQVVPYGKGFRVRQSASLSGRPVLCFVGRLSGSPSLVHATPMSPEFWSHVERERVRLGVELDMVEYSVALGLDRGRQPGASVYERHRRRTVLGYMVSTLGLSDAELETALQVLVKLNRPVSVLMEGRVAQVPRSLSGNRLLRFFPFAASSLHGEIVARHLLDLGHRTVAFITPYHRSEWCIERLRGVKGAFAAAGLPDGVVLFDASVDNLLARMVKQKPFSTFQRQLRQFEDAVSRPYDLTQDLFEKNLALHHMEAQYLKSHLEPYLTRALQDRAITAWIGATDMVGLIALAFLRTGGVRVPQAKSVISYDDTIEAFGVGLSSYSFNVAAIVQAMFDHITSGPSRRARGPQVLAIPGVVMARATTGPAPTVSET
jgi:hypothetical protein